MGLKKRASCVKSFEEFLINGMEACLSMISWQSYPRLYRSTLTPPLKNVISPRMGQPFLGPVANLEGTVRG